MAVPGQSKFEGGGRKRKITNRQPKYRGASSELTASDNEIDVESDMGKYKQYIGNIWQCIGGHYTKFVKGVTEFVGGTFSTSTQERSNVSADPGALATGKQELHNNDKKELTAIRNGFNDNRNENGFFANLAEFLSLPTDLIKSIIPSLPETTANVTNTGNTQSDNLFTDIYKDVKKEFERYSKALSQIKAKSIAKQAEVVLKEKKERLKIMQEQLKKIKDPAVQKRMMSNFPFSLFSGPATESAKGKLQDNLDKDETAKRAGKIAAKQAKRKN
jgi:hypothetical protein